jgi:hypothetical protein
MGPGLNPGTPGLSGAVTPGFRAPTPTGTWQSGWAQTGAAGRLHIFCLFWEQSMFQVVSSILQRRPTYSSYSSDSHVRFGHRSRFTPAFKDQSEGNTPQWLDTWRSNRLKQETSWKHEEVGNVTGLALNSLIHRHFLWAYWLSMVKSLSLRSGGRQPPLWGVGLRERILVTTEKHQKNHQRATSTAFEFGQRDKTSQL